MLCEGWLLLVGGLGLIPVRVKRSSPVGAGLPAKAVCQSLHLLLHYRFRRQASSHIGSSLLWALRSFN